METKMAKGTPIKPVGKARGPQAWQNLMQAKDLPKVALVYEVRATDGSGQPVAVTYKGSTDPTGMIYIGEQGDGVIRVNDLLTGFQTLGKKDPHGAPTKFFKEGLDKQYPVDQLEIRVTLVDQSSSSASDLDGLFDRPAEKGKPSDAKASARLNERGLIRKFQQTYNRLPPLNKQQGYHTRKLPLAPSPGEAEPDGDDLVQMEPVTDDQLQKAKVDHKATKRKLGKKT